MNEEKANPFTLPFVKTLMQAKNAPFYPLHVKTNTVVRKNEFYLLRYLEGPNADAGLSAWYDLDAPQTIGRLFYPRLKDFYQYHNPKYPNNAPSGLWMVEKDNSTGMHFPDLVR